MDSATPLRAFVLFDRHDDDASQRVVFARDRNHARRLGLDCVEYIDTGARRAPAFDGHAAAGRHVTARDYLDAGWYLECGACGQHVTADWEPIVDGDSAYCSGECHARDVGRIAGYRFRDRELSAAVAEAKRRWPDAEVCWYGFNQSGYREPPPADGFRIGLRLYWRRDDANVYANWDEGDATHSALEAYPR